MQINVTYWLIHSTEVQYGNDIGTVNCGRVSAHMQLINVLTLYNTLYSANTQLSPDTAPPCPLKIA